MSSVVKIDMFKKIGLYYRTIKHLKPIQIRYRLWYILRNKLRQLAGHNYPLLIPKEGNTLNLKEGIPKPSTCNFQPATTSVSFTFLNQSHTFEEAIDWNLNRYGKLWTYNFNYFDYLHQPEMTKEQGLKLIQSFIDQIRNNREGMEPYPTSLRGINWINFLNKHEISDKEVDASLYAQYRILMDNLEYHLLGNHLLENGFSLLFGAFYFQDKKLFDTALRILKEQLEEQILGDGGHFERTPMYQQILLDRLLDCINLVKNNTWINDKYLNKKLISKASLMLGWLQEISFKNNNIPLVNDATLGIAPDKQELEEYAKRLNVSPKKVQLKESGYRKFDRDGIELLIDIGRIGPDYQPAHAHSDTFNFILHYDNKPIIVDTGISTYEDSDRRLIERGTSAHNTVKYGDIEQSEVWSAFRVGRRAKPFKIQKSESSAKAFHDGYSHLGVIHSRKWKLIEDSIVITDWLQGQNQKESKAYFHIHPDIEPEITEKDIFQVADIMLSFDGCKKSELKHWSFASGFNKLVDGFKIEVSFTGKLRTRITCPV